jgi:hypothetical protein
MAESLVPTKIIDDPQEVKELFMKKYIDDEKSHHYDEKVHFPSQYTFHCDKQEFSKFIPQVLSPLTDLATKAIALLKEAHATYEEYHDQIEKMIEEIDIIDVLLAIFLVNIDEKAIASSCVTNVLNKSYMESLINSNLDENVCPNQFLRLNKLLLVRMHVNQSFTQHSVLNSNFHRSPNSFEV